MQSLGRQLLCCAKVSSLLTVRRSFIMTLTLGRSMPTHSTSQNSGSKLFQIVSYHSTPLALSKNNSKKGAKGGKDKGGDDDTAPAVKLPDIKVYEKSMDGTLNWVTNELSKMKIGRISADMFTNLPVESFGTVGKAGQVTLKSNTKLVVAVFDPSMTKPVADAIRACGLNLNPIVEGSNVMATIPKPSKESRDAMVKAAQKLAEKAKTDIRNMRKNCMDDIKKCKGSVSEDDMKRHTKDMESITEKKLEKVSQLIKTKENEINSSSD